MEQQFTWKTNDVSLVFSYGDDAPVAMIGYAVPSQGIDVRFAHAVPILEVLASGSGHWLACGKLTHTSIGKNLRYAGHRVSDAKAARQLADQDGRNETVSSWAKSNMDRLDIDLFDAETGIKATVTYEVADGAPMVRVYATVRNSGQVSSKVTLESVTSFAGSFGAPADAEPTTPETFGDWKLTEADMDWLSEGRWQTTPLRRLFPRMHEELTGWDPRGRHQVVSTGTWSTGQHAPLAVLSNDDLHLAWVFQVEHNGAWRWEVGQDTEDGYLALSGPTQEDHAWQRTLEPGDDFVTVPASFAIAKDVDGAVEDLTAYRRAWRYEHVDNTKPSVVFNDYMNTIYGDPTTEKELPLIEAAGKAGIEIFVIDCGWYDDTGNWWPSVGEWMPSKTRFPGKKGIVEVIDAIKDAGMIPGIWLEPEVIGVESPVAKRLPDSAFIMRNGHRVVEQQRYILDFRSRDTVKYMDSVIDRIVREYGVGYFKLDYNVSPGAGSDVDAENLGTALLDHNRAYSAWIEGLQKRYPDLILENCSSGGMREDFAQTSRFQVQSTSDQQDWRVYPTIAAASPMLMLPEQAASWAYPQSGMTPEETAFNINTTFLGRFFLSGYLNRMDEAQLELVERGINAYRAHVQPVIGSSVPFWPLGLPSWDASVIAYGLRPAEGHAKNGTLLTVWDRASQDASVRLPLEHLKGHQVSVCPIYPVTGFAQWHVEWDVSQGILEVSLPKGEYASRTFELVVED